MAPERQVSWSRGALSPSLWGRTDLSEYGLGARTIRNFLVTPHGVLTARTGTQHIATARGAGRVVPFIYDETDNVILLFTHLRIEVWTCSDDNPRFTFTGPAATIVTPYDEDDLDTLRFAQLGNVLTIVSSLYTPRELTRSSASHWQLLEMSFERIDFALGPTLNVPCLDVDTYPIDINDNNARSVWQWQVTRLVRSTVDGLVFETAPYTITKVLSGGVIFDGVIWPLHLSLSATRPKQLALQAEDGDAYGSGFLLAAPYRIVGTRVYRGREGRFGYVGETKKDSFIDEGQEPDYSDPPPQEFNPFKIYEDGVLVRTEKPSAVAYFENRLMLASTAERPNFLWGSAVGDYKNHDEIRPPDDDDALRLSLAARSNEQIRFLVDREVLVAGTSSSVRLIRGSGQGEILTPNSIAQHAVSRHGCSGDVAPEEVGNAVFYIDPTGTKVHALVLTDSGVVDMEASLNASHFFDGYTVVSWAYAPAPHSILWVVRSDGRLLAGTCALLPNGVGVAWSEHPVAGAGLVEAVAVKAEGAEHGVYVLVDRDDVHTLERLAYYTLPLRQIETEEDDGTISVEGVPDIRYAVNLDRAVSYDGRQADGVTTDFVMKNGDATLTIGGATFTVVFDPSGPDRTGMTIQIDDPFGGKPARFKLNLLDVFWGPNAYAAQLVSGSFENIWTDTEQTVRGSEWFECVTGVSGLDHLEGQTVTALVDGNLREGLVVQAGGISLGEDVYAAVVHVGLPYDPDFESLASIAHREKQKIVERTYIELERSRGGSAGPTLDKLTDLPARATSDGYLPILLKREEREVAIVGQYGKQGYIAFRGPRGLPCTVLGIAREIK